MGALDWLSDIIGGGGSAGDSGMPPMNPMGDMSGVGAPQMQGSVLAPPRPPVPPVGNPMGDQGTDPRIGTPPMPPGGDPMNGMGSGNNGGLSPQPPFPQGGDPMAGSGAGNGPGLPPGMPVPPVARSASPPLAPSQPPVPPTDLSAASRMMPPPPDSGPQAKSIIGRALGLDPNKEKEMFGSLAGGLNAAGNSKGKGKGQALFSGAGGALEGGNKAAKETTDEQDRYLQRKLAAGTAENTAANGQSTRDLNIARTQLALAQAKQAMTGGKESVVNSDQQLYLRAQGAAAQDGRLKALKTAADQASTQFGADSAQAKAAIKAHKEAYDATVEGHAKALGLDPGKIGKIGKQPGMSADNPVPKDGLTQEKFDKLASGSYFINPKDGQVLIKKGADPAATGGNQPAPAQQQAAPATQQTPPLPPIPPTPVTAPAGSQADDED
jgi:hypothetical protein